jgi:hypothetical protein
MSAAATFQGEYSALEFCICHFSKSVMLQQLHLLLKQGDAETSLLPQKPVCRVWLRILANVWIHCNEMDLAL